MRRRVRQAIVMVEFVETMISDNEIITILCAAAKKNSPVQVAELLDELADCGLTQGSLITYFKRAFPETPLRLLIDLGDWQRVGGLGKISNEEVNALLAPWMGNSTGGIQGSTPGN